MGHAVHYAFASLRKQTFLHSSRQTLMRCRSRDAPHDDAMQRRIASLVYGWSRRATRMLLLLLSSITRHLLFAQAKPHAGGTKTARQTAANKGYSVTIAYWFGVCLCVNVRAWTCKKASTLFVRIRCAPEEDSHCAYTSILLNQ